MKNSLRLWVAVTGLITALIFSSCGSMKNNDFSSQKYTHFKKGKTTVTIDQAVKGNNDAGSLAIVTDQKKVADVTPTATDNTSQSMEISKPEIKKDAVKKVSQFNAITKETKKEKITRSVYYVKDRLINKSNTASNNTDGMSLFWVVILILLIFWAVGAASGGFGLGGLINILLVIALILLILWLLQIV
jgi:hypothetical protein